MNEKKGAHLKKSFYQRRIEYSRQDFRQLSQREIDIQLLSLIKNERSELRFGEVQLTQDVYFVRARLEEDGVPYNHCDDFWAPPVSVAKLGRCNKAGSSKLYTVWGVNIERDLLSIIEELNIKPGNRFVVIVYKLKNRDSLNVPVCHDLNPELFGSIPVNSKVSKFLISEFKINPEIGLRDRYKSTAAIVELLMDLRGHRCKTPVFIYPSCAMNRALQLCGNGVINIAWDSEFAKENLKIESLRRVTLNLDSGWAHDNSLDDKKKSIKFYFGERGVILSTGKVSWEHVINPAS
ncbi:hypothetical protein HQN60_00610 [Deefgea piscis]|uniref:Uncharacterized protein n=1 Tax=Deefgea piscis TaxID=2739061 RepID=A0A6M8SL30_9NEIS|nr:hypothetical protein [Deefgea piscis]QKJ65361.1 hypothetical protein HQN60_00610 [Deefgea piscis]